MLNLLQFVPKTGRRQHNECVAAATPALGRHGERIAFHSQIIVESGYGQKQCLIGAYPDSFARSKDPK